MQVDRSISHFCLIEDAYDLEIAAYEAYPGARALFQIWSNQLPKCAYIFCCGTSRYPELVRCFDFVEVLGSAVQEEHPNLVRM